jgi:hypothetical protein
MHDHSSANGIVRFNIAFSNLFRSARGMLANAADYG